MLGYSEQQVELICLAHGHKYISGYINNKLKFKAVCQCGSTYETILGNITAGHRCSNCSGGIKHSQEYISTLLTSMGLELIGEYKQSRIPMDYICTCGGIGHTVLHKLIAGQRCGKCAENNWHTRFWELGYEILEYNSARDILFRCTCGYTHRCQANNWLTQHKGCPKCKIKYNYNPDKLTRPNFYSWRKKVLLRDNTVCVNCQSNDLLEAHHIVAFTADPKLGTELSNGITLCKTCHTDLHSVFGYNVGLDNLINSLKENGVIWQP